MHSLFAALLLAASSPFLHAIQYSNVEMLCLVNQQRQQNGLPALGLDPDLTNAAVGHSQDQARMGQMSHDGSDGSQPSDRVEAAGFHWFSVGENVAYGYNSMQEVMAAWMKSPGHRANILGKQYTMFGSGVASKGSTQYFTQDFGNDDKGCRNVPRCDGSDQNIAGNGNSGGQSYGGNSNSNYGSSNGGQDNSGGNGSYGSSNGVQDDSGNSNSYGSSNGGQDDGGNSSYGSNGGQQGHRRGGRHGGGHKGQGGGHGGRRHSGGNGYGNSGQGRGRH